MAHRQVFSAMGLLAAAAAEIAVCPGESERYGDFKCNHDPTHRVCATLLDGSGKPLAWGSNGTFWEITGQSAFQWDDRIRANHGDSWCICMWATARLIETVGCENIHLNCDATDVAYVENSYQDSGVSLAPAKSCLERKCPKQSPPQPLDDASLPASVPGSMPQRSMANWMPSSFLPLKLGGVLVALIAGVAMYVRSPGRQDTQLREARLQYMVQMEQSFQAIYGSSNINVDFSVIQRVQAMHPHMKLILSSTADVREMLRNTSLRKDVWRAIEARAKFQQDLANMEKKAPKGKALKQLRGFVKHLVHGQKELRSLFRQLFTELEELARNGNLERPPPPQRAVPRRDASELSVEEFINAYARPGLPVIITGLNITEEEPWSLEFFKGRCTKKVPLQRRNPRSDSWGRLEKAGRLPLAEFIDSFTTNATRRKWYLHDWSLPRYCPAAFGPPPFRGFTVPKYFVGDYFQRAGFEGYQHTWPSLFIGSNETLSAMHIDSGNTNFMMHLLSGRKEWRFFSRKDLINLYYSPNGAHFHLDIFQPDLQKFPLARYAEQFVGIQEAGELIFIPAGNPHGVRNLDHIHGVSMNYVDLSNVELSILESVWDNEGDKVELYTDGKSIPHGILSSQSAMRFGEWKAKDWKKESFDLF